MSKIIFIGSGNVATQLGLALKSRHAVLQVCSPNNASRLAKKLSAKAIPDLKNISPDADIYIVAVKDDAIADVVKKMPKLNNKLVIHTSGATDIAVLKKKFKNCGVIWQVQTIRVRTKIDFRKVPLVIEASNASSLKEMKKLCSNLSPLIYVLNSAQRRVLHLGAVWVNNFPNHLYHLAELLLKKHKMPYKIFAPLILSTAASGIQNPKEAQTGPAKRNDTKTMAAHLKLISGDKTMQKIYKLISDSIYRSK